MKVKKIFIVGFILIILSSILSALTANYSYKLRTSSTKNIKSKSTDLYTSPSDFNSTEEYVNGVLNKRSKFVAIGYITTARTPTSGNYNKLNFDSADIYDDEYASYSSGTITLKKAGRYRISYHCRFADVTATKLVYLGPSINGATTDSESGTWGNITTRLTVDGTYSTYLSASTTINVLMSGSSITTTGINKGQFIIEHLVDVN